MSEKDCGQVKNIHRFFKKVILRINRWTLLYQLLYVLVLLLCGKPTGKPKHNCPYCDGTAPFETPGNLYSIGDLFLWHKV